MSADGRLRCAPPPVLHRHARPVVSYGAIHPGRREGLPLRACLSSVGYVALVREREEHEARPRGRGPDSTDGVYLGPSLAFDDRLRASAGSTEPPMVVLDTTTLDQHGTADAVAARMREAL